VHSNISGVPLVFEMTEESISTTRMTTNPETISKVIQENYQFLKIADK
jgi:hypothetical protein